MPGSLEGNDHKIDPVFNPWEGMVSEVDPRYVKGSSKVGRRALPITGEERQRIIATAAKSRQKWKAREQEMQQQRAKREYTASGSGKRPLAAPRPWIKQELSWTTKVDPAVEAAPVVPEGGDAEMSEVFAVGGLGNQDPAPKPIPGASKTQEPIHPKKGSSSKKHAEPCSMSLSANAFNRTTSEDPSL